MYEDDSFALERPQKIYNFNRTGFDFCFLYYCSSASSLLDIYYFLPSFLSQTRQTRKVSLLTTTLLRNCIP